MSLPGGALFIHAHARALMYRHRRSANESDIYCTQRGSVRERERGGERERENRYLHKALHLVSLRWRWWGEGWPVNMKRYTHYLSVWAWQHRDIMRCARHHLGAKWTDAMGTVGESPWGWDWEWGLGQRDHRLLTATVRRPAVTSHENNLACVSVWILHFLHHPNPFLDHVVHTNNTECYLKPLACFSGSVTIHFKEYFATRKMHLYWNWITNIVKLCSYFLSFLAKKKMLKWSFMPQRKKTYNYQNALQLLPSSAKPTAFWLEIEQVL